MRLHRKLVLVAGLFLVGSIVGCPGKGTVAPMTGSGAKAVARTVSADDLLQSAISQLRPENYMITAESDKPVTLLTSWAAMVAEKSKNAAESAAPIPTGWIDDRNAERMKSAAFDQRDAIHVRDAMLNYAIANFLSTRGKSEVQRVVETFDYVVRNISLRGPNDPDLPLGTYYVMLLGMGSPEDRALVFAALLKQLRIDTVIVQSSDPAADSEAWLVGVVLNDQVYLFDARLGIPIPSSDDLSQSIQTPATLKQIVDHGEWLKMLAYRADQPYPLDVESLKNPRIFPIADSNFWFPRMKQLEESLPAKDPCVIYDPLVNDQGRTGLLTRLTTAIPEWKADQLQPWSHLRRMNTPVSPAVQQQFAAMLGPFEMPFSVHRSERDGSISVGKPERKMLRIRTDHLLGYFEDANKRYFSIRHLEIDPDQVQVPQLAPINQRAAEDAIYWSAICKFEAREFEAAIEQLNGYLRRYERTGHWNFSSRALLGECYVELKDFGSAVSALEKATRREDPYRAGNEFRIKRWKACAEKQKSTDAK